MVLMAALFGGAVAQEDWVPEPTEMNIGGTSIPPPPEKELARFGLKEENLQDREFLKIYIETLK